jgi:hypothetical protein
MCVCVCVELLFLMIRSLRWCSIQLRFPISLSFAFFLSKSLLNARENHQQQKGTKAQGKPNRHFGGVCGPDQGRWKPPSLLKQTNNSKKRNNICQLHHRNRRNAPQIRGARKYS